MNARQEFKDMYFHFKEAFGVDNPGWVYLYICRIKVNINN